jgi:predicted nuclease of predicted toxin-antitoxin system
MSLLSNSIRILNAALKITGGESITYRRGNDTIDITAVPVRTSQTDFSLDAEVALTARERDWIILTEDLAFGGQLALPQPDDAIGWIDSLGNLHTYTVLPRAGERCYRYTDQTLIQLRIFTVEAIASDE